MRPIGLDGLTRTSDFTGVQQVCAGGGGATTLYSLVFDGSSGYVTMGNVLDNAGNVTTSVSCWVKYTMGGAANIASKQQNSGSFIGWGFGLAATGKLQFFFYNGVSGVIATTTSAYNDGAW